MGIIAYYQVVCKNPLFVIETLNRAPKSSIGRLSITLAGVTKAPYV